MKLKWSRKKAPNTQQWTKGSSRSNNKKNGVRNATRAHRQKRGTSKCLWICKYTSKLSKQAKKISFNFHDKLIKCANVNFIRFANVKSEAIHTWKQIQFGGLFFCYVCSATPKHGFVVCLFFFLGCRCSSLLAFVRFACFLVLFRLICFVNVICASCIHQHQRDTTKTAQFYRKHKYKTRESTNNAEKVNQHFLFRTKNEKNIQSVARQCATFFPADSNSDNGTWGKTTMYFCHANMPKNKIWN